MLIRTELISIVKKWVSVRLFRTKTTHGWERGKV